MIKHFSLSEPVQVSFESSFTTANPNISSAKPDCCMYVFGRNSYNYHMIGIWNIGDKEWKEVKLNISACMLKQMNGFSLETIKRQRDDKKCCRLVRRGEVLSPENSLLYVFGQANPAPTADDGIGRFCFGILTNGVTLLISPPMQSPAVSSPGWHVPL